MKSTTRHAARRTLLLIALATASMISSECTGARAAAPADVRVPSFQYDPSWPKPLPNHWLLGQIAGMTTDAQGHIWVQQRPATLTSLGEMHGLNGEAECCFPAPPILVFDTQGNLLQYWGAIHDK